MATHGQNANSESDGAQTRQPEIDDSGTVDGSARMSNENYICFPLFPGPGGAGVAKRLEFAYQIRRANGPTAC